MAHGGIMKKKINTLNPLELRRKGIEALTKTLGPVGMVRFLHLFESGYGNYTEERKEWLKDLKLEEILKEIEEKNSRKKS